jgi:hypothetical protein
MTLQVENMTLWMEQDPKAAWVVISEALRFSGRAMAGLCMIGEIERFPPILYPTGHDLH